MAPDRLSCFTADHAPQPPTQTHDCSWCDPAPGRGGPPDPHPGRLRGRVELGPILGPLHLGRRRGHLDTDHHPPVDVVHLRRPPESDRGTGLAAVACGSPTVCLALDTSGRAYRQTGSGWTGPATLTSQARGSGGVSLSCAGPSSCVAIPTGGDQAVSWDGRAWNPPGTVAAGSALEAVGCASSGYCAAVDAEGNAFALSGGSWHATSGDWGSVSAVSCVSATFCVSVSGGISRWDGSSWTTPDSLGAASSFTGVSCPAPTACTAVDTTGEALSWNGTAWSAPVPVEPMPVPGAGNDPTVTAVSCPTSSFCASVDDAGGLLLERNGSWTRTEVDPGHGLTGISCPSPTACLAVDDGGNVLVGKAG